MSAAAFEQATQDVLKLTVPLKSHQQLELYGYFKIAKGEDIKAAAAPGWLEIKDKMKRSAWQGLLDKGVTQEKAQQEYVKLVEGYKDTNAYDANKSPEKVGA